jgi:pimeloyl-ACP methyl ester carboxylesterase
MESKLIEKQIDIGEYTIFYQQSGKITDAIPLLLIHGWAISTEPYQEILNHLAQRHPIIAPDLPGFGRSKSPQPLEDYDSYAKPLLDFMKALSIEKAHLVGHSLGGGIAIKMAALEPQRVQSLILVDSTGIPVNSILEVLLHRAIEMPAQLSLPKLKLLLVDIPQVFIHNLLFNSEQVIQSLFLSLQADLRSILPQIQFPCLILWSEKDLTFSLQAAQEFSQLIPGSVLITVPEGFHEWVLLHPEKFASIVSNFINHNEKTW